ncbi:MAG: DUF4406 domain-containing protein [Acetatifactor sp.]|jgi:hypothetical protein|nr:DUF4406 domain-containing protein [Acetatifactor sp.]
MDISNVKDKIVYVASPYAGDIEKNVRYAQDACRAVLLAGAHPYAPHLYITNILRDDVPEEREQGLKTGLAFLTVCDELWVFGPRISNGMAGEIAEAKRLGKPIRYMDLDLKIIEQDS